MKTHNLGKKFHPINLRKLAKPVALCISVLFIIIIMLSALSSTAVQARTIQRYHQQPTQTPAPTPTPTSTPAPTPTPAPLSLPSSNNLVPIPSAWTTATATNGNTFALGGVANDVLDTSVLYNGNPSIRIDPVGRTDNYGRECDGPWLAISPGDTITFSCWMKTTASSLGDKSLYAGARIGIDMYANGRITGLITPTGENDYYNPTDANLNYVHWGTSAWTEIVMKFTVASTYASDGGGAYRTGQMVAPTGIIPWMQVWSSTYGASDSGSAWFVNAQLTITT